MFYCLCIASIIDMLITSQKALVHVTNALF